MGRKRADLNDLFEEAEQRQSCVVAREERTSQQLRRRLRSGEAICLAPRVYARKQYWDELNPTARTVHLIKALGERTPDMVFSHVSAAIAYGLQVPWGITAPLHCVVSSASHTRSTKGLVRHSRTNLDAVVYDGIRVTSPERTVFDCLSTLDLPDGLAIADSVLATGLMGKDRLLDAVGTHEGEFGFEHAMQTVNLADGRAANGGESYARAVMLELGCMPPDLQHRLIDPVTGQEYYADYYWEIPESRSIAGELDGWGKYFDEDMTKGKSLDEVLFEERRRESRITALDVKVMRFRFADVLSPVEFSKLLGTFGVPMGCEPPLVLPHPSLGDGVGTRKARFHEDQGGLTRHGIS